ncbi:MAG: fatty acid desaturase [Gammaproteobacteria bacterium]|nr:fatty acid desaturase [Gammaproteobacteria bacterium]
MSKDITVPQNTPISDETKAKLARELAKLRSKANKDLSLSDFKHLKKVERIGRFCTLLGYGTAWIIPNPISAFLISMGNFNRWANIAHPISHGGYDKIKGVPKRYTSKHFAQGYRRMIDWPDWMLPAGWHQEHNQLHHYRLGENEDPDQVERNLEWLRESKLPMWVRYTIVALFACFWKPLYYAQSTLKELRVIRAKKEGRDPSEVPSSMSIKVWSPFYKEGREYWGQCILPYAGLRFIVIPALFFPLGSAAVSSVFFTSLLAEVFTNLHSFLVIVPNHSGDDIVRFKNPTNDRKEYYYRQIVGSVNFPVGSDLNDILHGWLNYQIEHHLWPTLPLSQYQKLQPEVKALCDKYGVPYRQESVFRRLKKVADIMTGKTSMLWEIETPETQQMQSNEVLKSANA